MGLLVAASAAAVALVAAVIPNVSHGAGIGNTALVEGNKCSQEVTVIGARGSGDPQGGDVRTDKYGDSVHGMGKPGAAFAVDLANGLPRGAVSFLPLEYPAVGLVGDWRKIINLVGAKTPLPFLGAYHGSVNDGEQELRQTVRDEERLCPNIKLVLLGYSQGAQVVADVYEQNLESRQRSQIAGVALFGDPYFNPNSPADHGSYDPTRHGILGTRASFPANRSALVFSICHRDDPICQGPGHIDFSQHTNYQTDPWVQVMAAAIANRFAKPTTPEASGNGATIAAAPILVPGRTYQVDLRTPPTARLSAHGETQQGGLCPMWAGHWWRLKLRKGNTVSISWTASPPADGFYQYLIFSPDTNDRNANLRANNNQQLQFVNNSSGSGSGSFTAPASGLYPFIIGDGCPSTSGPFRFVVTVSRS
jgi:hypothetical protein